MPNEPDSLGPRLSRLRRERGMSLRELGRMADVSAASLSTIENGHTSPTLATLHKILKALGTDFAEFFAAPSGQGGSPVFPAGEMRTIEDAHRRYTLLVPRRMDVRFELMRETISPSETDSEWETHDVDVGGVVLSGGPVRLEIEDQGEWQMNEGDAFYVKAGLKHRATNLGDTALDMITVAYPPRY